MADRAGKRGTVYYMGSIVMMQQSTTHRSVKVYFCVIISFCTNGFNQERGGSSLPTHMLAHSFVIIISTVSRECRSPALCSTFMG